MYHDDASLGTLDLDEYYIGYRLFHFWGNFIFGYGIVWWDSGFLLDES